MKNKTQLSVVFSSVIISSFFILSLSSCKKKKDSEPSPVVQVQQNLPIVSTSPVTNIDALSATCGGNVSSEGTSAITAVGLCWDTLPGPTTLRFLNSVGAGTGTFVATINSLRNGVKYYVRAYARNASGTAYGNEQSFTTLLESNTSKLTGKNFKMTAYTVSPVYYGSTDFYALMTACQKDDLSRFETNGSYTIDAGSMKCNPSDPQTITGSWIWKSGETILNVSRPSSSIDYEVLTNDGSVLKLQYTELTNAITYTFIMTYVKQ